MQEKLKRVILLVYCLIIHHCSANEEQHIQKQETIRFSSLLDTVLDIWQDSSLLSDFDTHQTEWLTVHDLLVGRLTRLKNDIQAIENEQLPNTVLVSDFEYIVKVLQQIESNFMDQADREAAGIIILTKTIRETIQTLL